MKVFLRILTGILVAMCFSSPTKADSKACADSLRILPRPVTSSYSAEIGIHWGKSTYLSPYYYKGTDFALSGSWTKAMPIDPARAMMSFDSRIAAWTQLTNPGDNATMQGFDIDFFWGLQAFWRLPYSLSVAVGGGPEFDGGILMLLRNSNNPVEVNLSAALSANAGLCWQGAIGKLPISATWSLRMPVIGAFFMPGYGETYYEIYVGNHSGLVHAGWPGNHLRINSHLAVQLDFGRTAMEIGYRMITDRLAANNLVTRQLTHSFTIGVIPHGLGRKNHRNENRVYF